MKVARFTVNFYFKIKLKNEMGLKLQPKEREKPNEFPEIVFWL